MLFCQNVHPDSLLAAGPNQKKYSLYSPYVTAHGLDIIFFLHVFFSVFSPSRPPWFDLPPPPYLYDGELPSEGELPQYEGPQDPLSHPTAHHSVPSTPRTVASGTQRSSSSREESDQL